VVRVLPELYRRLTLVARRGQNQPEPAREPRTGWVERALSPISPDFTMQSADMIQANRATENALAAND
jgi:hypothetical protein